jgi:hypothetical protein
VLAVQRGVKRVLCRLGHGVKLLLCAVGVEICQEAA